MMSHKILLDAACIALLAMGVVTVALAMVQP